MADGFYEWKKEGKKKTPVYITLKTKEPFGFADLWEVWKDPVGEEVHSCTIIATKPNSSMEPIHSRMPVIPPRELKATWLDQGIGNPVLLTELLTPYPAEEMQAR